MTGDVRDFETLFDRFQVTAESLESAYAALQERVRLLQEELEDERAQRIELERLAAMGEMAMELAHEIRNPLGSIELFASMLDGPYAEQIVRGVRLLNHAVTNVLDFGQPINPVFDAVDLPAIARDAAIFLEPLASGKDVRIGCEGHSRVTALGDRELLHRMLLNLLLNALREVPRGGMIAIETIRRGDHAWISVADNGRGIPPEIAGKIFDPMFSASRDGCGIGLSVVRRIVESHGGEIAVDSSTEGTRFRIRLQGGGAMEGVAA
jgi:two-component system sensor histidine kinase FlrB